MKSCAYVLISQYSFFHFLLTLAYVSFETVCTHVFRSNIKVVFVGISLSGISFYTIFLERNPTKPYTFSPIVLKIIKKLCITLIKKS